MAIALVIWFWFSLPGRLFTQPTSYVLMDSDGHLLSASIAEDGQWRFPFDPKVPDKFRQCITVFEDRRFYYHPGIDPIAMARAVIQNVEHGKVVSGGSTLTMQVARMYRQNGDRNLWNKLTETITAIRLELSYKKDDILALYASNAPFGTNVVGLDAAAWRYYGRNPGDLSWGETAGLAVLPNAPALVHPGKNTAILLKKRNGLLDRLVEANVIDRRTGDLAKLEPLPQAPKPLPQLAPHLLNRFRKDFITAHTGGSNGSTAVKTTIDGQLQRQVNDILFQHHEQLKGNQINNMAAMVLDVESGNILAYTGNVYLPGDPAIESDVDVLSSRRSPGSTLKPLLYASLLSEGTMLPRELVPDIPTQVGGYMPENFDLGYDGAVPANRALSRSLNIPAVRMLMQFKYQKFYDVLKGCGFTTLDRPADNYGMSLILGGCEISPFELAGVYASMARMYNHEIENKGRWNQRDWFMPHYVGGASGVGQGQDGMGLRALFDYPALWHTFNAMNEVMRPGEEGLWNLFSSAERIAWKTGTSFGFRDGWAVGFTPKYCVVVWVGNTTGEGRPELTGINTAAPVLFEIFRLLPQSAWFHPPRSGFTYLPVCHESGFKAGPNCPDVDTVLVSERAQNARVCPYHRVIHLDGTGKFRVTSNCMTPSAMHHVSWFVLPPAMEYYYRQRHPEYRSLPPYLAGCGEEELRAVDIIYPEENARIYVPLDVSGERGKTVFTAAARDVDAKLFWHIDDVFVGTTTNFHQMALTPVPGRHVLTVVDEHGDRISRHFEVMQKGP